MTIGQRIERVIDEKKLSYVQVARTLDISVQYLKRIRAGTADNVSITIYKAFCYEYNVRLPWLLTGKGEMFFPALGIANVEPANMPSHRVPLISWVQAGALHEPIDIYQPGFADEWESTSVSGPNVFALRVVGDSMHPEYREGDIIIINPNIDVETGDDAIVKINGEVTFKQVHFYLNKIKLIPLNDNYEPIEILRDDGFNIMIIGKVVELKRRK